MIHIRDDLFVRAEDISAIHDSDQPAPYSQKKDTHALIVLRNGTLLHVFGMSTVEVADKFKEPLPRGRG